MNLSQLRDSCLTDFHLFYDQSEQNFHTPRTNKSVSLRCSLSIFLLPPATKLGQGNIFRSVCHEFCPRGEACMEGAMHGQGGMRGRGGVCGRGMCMVGSMHGQGCVCGRGACVARGHAWLGGMCGRGHAWQILGDTVNERAVRILWDSFLS